MAQLRLPLRKGERLPGFVSSLQEDNLAVDPLLPEIVGRFLAS